jgi:hypothetical protein
MTALDRQQPVLAALIAALLADAGLAALIGTRIYDAPPGRSAMPEVTIKLVTAADRSTADTEAQALTFDCDVWDRYALGADLSRPRAVMASIRRILHMQPLAVPGVGQILLRCTAAQGPFRDPDTVALHGIVTVVALAGHESVMD